MEMENKWASRGVGAAALTTGIIGSTLGAVNSGIVNRFVGSAANCPENMPVTRYELEQLKELINKDMEIAYLRGRDASKSDDLELYKTMDGRFRGVESQIASQAVTNAQIITQITANISCMQQNLAVLNGLTKTVVPIDSICPLPAVATTTATAGA